ncbi:unnamed protein product [Somion occarium]|uniref:Fungal-type protein kinase domain-containing protein n=1 Tax=Somion occarium TaxID=3059160 RepID=A0ABP1DX97_9APHY
MAGLFVGTMPPRGCLVDFLRIKSLEKLKTSPKVDLSGVPFKKVEKDMYEPLCNAINDSGICDGFKLVEVSSSVERDDIRLRPDLAFVSSSAEDPMDYTIMEFFVDAKLSDLADPFYDKDKCLDDTTENMTEESAETRGQIIAYTTALLSRQHRRFTFSIVICGQYARFLRWDRAGCIVSDIFDYLEEPDILLDFFWYYARLTREERGFDPTVVPASAAEAILFSDALSRYIEESKPRDVSYLQPKPDSTYSISKMPIPMAKGNRELIVGKPSWDADSPDGTTRAYAAYDMVGHSNSRYIKWGPQTKAQHLEHARIFPLGEFSLEQRRQFEQYARTAKVAVHRYRLNASQIYVEDILLLAAAGGGVSLLMRSSGGFFKQLGGTTDPNL